MIKVEQDIERSTLELPASANDRQSESLSRAGQSRMQGERQQIPPVDQSDEARMTVGERRVGEKTRASLDTQGLTAASVVNDHTGDQAEAFARTVLEREGIPDGSGQMEPVKRVVPGTHDGKHGIDLIAATQDGKPLSIEVKKRTVAAKATLDEHPVSREALEPEVQRAIRERERQLALYRDGHTEQLRPDHADTWKPEVARWLNGLEADLKRCTDDPHGLPRLPVEQMDEWWAKDRYLKLLRSDGGPERLQTAGVAPEYCQLENFVDNTGNLRDTPLWDDILAGRTVVVLGPSDAAAGKRLFDQVAFEHKAQRVVYIRLPREQKQS